MKLSSQARRFRRYSSVCLTSLTLGLACVAPLNAGDYKITDLGENVKPLSISENGHIVGIIENGTDQSPIATLIETETQFNDDEVIVTTTNFELETLSEAWAVNQQQFIAGFANTDPISPRLWQGTTAQPDLETFNNISQAWGINDFDEVAGTRLVDGFKRPMWYDHTLGSVKTLATLGGAEAWATDINNVGQIIGTSDDEHGNPMGFIYDESRTEDEVSDVYKNIGTLDGFTGSTAVNINDGEDIVGWAFSDDLESPKGRRAILSPLGNSLVNLGALNHDANSVAHGISNSGQIVGQSIWADGTERAFLYDLSETDLLLVEADPKLPNRIYTGSTKGTGILRSDNKGDTWIEINRGLTNLTIQGITIHPNDSNIIYAGAQGAIFKSEDAGLQWVEISPEEMDTRIVYSVHVHSLDDSLLFVGTNGGMFYSQDEGESWTLFQRDDSEANEDIIGVFDFVETPNQPYRMYAATSEGVYRIDVDGNVIDWSPQNGDGERQLTHTFINTLGIPPGSQDLLFAGTSGGGVWVANINDGFLRWESRTNELDPLVSSIKFLWDDTMYAGTNGGLFISEDLGRSWNPVTALGNNRRVYTLAASVDENDDTTLYATTGDGGVFRTDDESAPEIALGSEWTAVTRGVDPPDVYKIIAHPDNTDTTEDELEIYLAASSGAYRWDSDEKAWAAASNTVKNIKISTIASDTSTTPTTLWAGSPDEGLFKSVDGGVNWFTINEGLDHWTIRSIAVDNSETPPIVYAATLGGVYRSDNGGDDWELAQSGLGDNAVHSLLLDTRAFPRALYAGTSDGVYRSVDTGLNWVRLNEGEPDFDGPGGKNIIDLQIDQPPTDAGNTIIYAAASGVAPGPGDPVGVNTPGKLYKSINAGLSWSEIDTGFANSKIYTIALDGATSPDTVYVGTPSGVYKSTDAGTTWENASGINSTDPDNEPVDELAIYTLAVSAENELHAGTKGNAVYKSHLDDDDNMSWQKLEAGLSDAVTNMQDLTELVGDSAWILHNATATNSAGQIVGYGEIGGKTHGFLLTPTIGLSSIDLSITQKTTPDVIKKYTPVVYQITVTNHGPDVATGISVTNWLSPRTLYRYASTDYGECRRRGQTIRCILGLLEPGQSAQINVSMEPQDTNVKILNIARVAANERDIDFSNNTTTQESGIVQVDRCFIATAAYGSFLDPHVSELRTFRDEYLLTNAAGRYFVDRYYEYSPPLAKLISEHESLRIIAKALLTPLVYAVRYPLLFGAILAMFIIWKMRRRLNLRTQQAIV